MKIFFVLFVAVLSSGICAEATFSDMYGYNIRKTDNVYEVSFTPVYNTVDETNLAPYSNLIGHKLRIQFENYVSNSITSSIRKQMDNICQSALNTDFPEITTALGNKVTGTAFEITEETTPLKGVESPYPSLNDDISEYCILSVGENMSQNHLCYGSAGKEVSVLSEITCTIHRK